MAFDAYRAQSQPHPRSGRRRLIYAASIALHAALIAGGIAYSFWHIEELTPPVVRVTFMASAPPPPPPPPPAGGGGAARKKPTTKPKVVPTKTPEIVQPLETPRPEAPKETPKPEEKPEEKPDEGVKGGVKGGVAGGIVGGTVGGTIGGNLGGTPGGVVGGTGTGAGPPAKFLPPHMGAAQKLTGPDPPFPPSLRRAGAIYRVLAKICVNTSGVVDKITIMKGADPQLDDGVLSTVKSSWRFRPLLANATPVPFCYPATFEFKSQ